MRQRRDPFARESYRPRAIAQAQGGSCGWCGQTSYPRHPLYIICIERDGSRDDDMRGKFCSWDCAESYHGTRIGR